MSEGNKMYNENTQIVKMFDNNQIRMTMKDDETWFSAKDVCLAFGEQNYRRAIQDLDQDEKGVSQMNTPGGMQMLVVVNEFGLYHLLMAMKPQKARGVSDAYIAARQKKLSQFRRWVTHEVLPQIRKTGSYNPKANDTIAKLANRITQLVMEKMELTAENRYLKQYHPDGVLGERSEESGLPRNFYRKASYVSRYGRHPKPKESYKQLDLFMDLPALQEARDALNMARDTRPQLFQ